MEKLATAFLSLQEFKSEEEIDLEQWEGKVDGIENVVMVRDYSKFITKMIYWMDNCNSSRVRAINDEKF